ncbi:cation:proton antiporter [Azospirillum halopraeferens]|uniref:cation:proton antiporter n=1 Tax=Azospirillum halopraeferens TaxID=34010 RepID=UPI0003F7EC36|nr:monovalent cation/H(+) antiporter subunit G [Azospirillum halopraeferens]
MTLTEILSVAFILAGAGFFVAGTVGLLRFPDLYTRLHAVTKADNLGVGLIAVGLVLQDPGWAHAAKLALVWMATLAGVAVAGNVLAKAALDHGVPVSGVPVSGMPVGSEPAAKPEEAER